MRLVVHRDGRRVGLLAMTSANEVQFTYDREVIDRNDPADAIGFRCPIRSKPWTGKEPLAVFENLLPEGRLRDVLGQLTKHDASDTVGLLGEVGAECAGALQLWPEGMEVPATASYGSVDANGIRKLFASASGVRGQLAGRASLSGAQAKLALLRTTSENRATPLYRVPLSGAPTNVVVKKPGSQFPGLLEAELVGMRLMSAAGVVTTSSERCAIAPECHESNRFDRTLADDGSILRLHAEDGCQLTARPSRAKYAERGAPTYQELIAVLDRLSIDPITDRLMLFRWAIVNAAIGNHDAHAKNIGVLYVQPDRVRLAPVYDVVVTALYPDLDQSLALTFAGTTNPNQFTRAGLRKAAREFRIAPAMAEEVVADVCGRIALSTDDVLEDVARLEGEEKVLQELREIVQRTAAGVRKGLLE